MILRREFALLVCAAVCAAALMYPAPRAYRALPGHGVASIAEISTDSDATMAALHRQASAALESLQASARQ
jgi:hypothetical protein